MEDPFVSAHQRQSRFVWKIFHADNTWAQLLAQSDVKTKPRFFWMLKAMSWFAEIAHLDLVTMESTKIIDQHIDEWKLDCHSLKYAKFESMSRYFHWHHEDRMVKSQYLQKTSSFHFVISLARQMRMGSYWYSATVRRIMMGGTGGRICLFCDLNCDEDLGHLFSHMSSLERRSTCSIRST